VTKKSNNLVWTPGTWTNREHDLQDGRHFKTFKLSGSNDPVLEMLHPDTPIDPEGNVGWWMVDNFDPREWYLVRVYTHRESSHPNMWHRIRTTREYLVELNPLFHLGWHHYRPSTGYRDNVLTGVMVSKFRPREGTELQGHISDSSATQKYPFTFRYRKELVSITRI